MTEGTEQGQNGGAGQAPGIPSGMESVLSALGGNNTEISQYIEQHNAASAEGANGAQQQHITTDGGLSVSLGQTDGSGTGETPPAGQENNASGNEASTDAAGAELPAAEGATGDAAAEEGDFIESPLFGGKKKLAGETAPVEGSTTPADMKTVEGITSVFKEKLGIESMDKIPEQLDALLKFKTDYESASVEMANVRSLFEQMPPELYQAIDLFAKGQDWKATVTGSAIDYSKPADQYQPKDLVNAMMPGKVTEAQWEEFQQEDCDPNVKALVTFAIDSAKDKFSSQSEQIKKSSEEMVQRSTQQKAAFDASIDKSKAMFAEKWKDADKGYMNQLEQDFKNGKIMEIFYNQDGTLREDAYVRAAMARDGENLVEQSLKMLENRKQSLVNKELLKQVSNTPSGGTGASAGARQELRPELQTRLDQIKQIAPKAEQRY
jgi:hypothetical protein